MNKKLTSLTFEIYQNGGEDTGRGIIYSPDVFEFGVHPTEGGKETKSFQNQKLARLYRNFTGRKGIAGSSQLQFETELIPERLVIRLGNKIGIGIEKSVDGKMILFNATEEQAKRVFDELGTRPKEYRYKDRKE